MVSDIERIAIDKLSQYYWLKWNAGQWEMLDSDDRRMGQLQLAEFLFKNGRPDEDLYSLLSLDWLNAWKFMDQPYAGFRQDITYTARRAIQNNSQLAFEMGLRCALCQSSIISLGAQIPPILIIPAIQYALLSPEQILDMLQQIPNMGREQMHIFAPLPAVIPRSLLSQVIHIIKQLPLETQAGSGPRMEAYAMLLSRIRENQAEKQFVMDPALENLWAVRDEMSFAYAAQTLAPYLSEEAAQAVATLLNDINQKSARCVALAALLKSLPAEIQEQTLVKILAEISGVDEEERRVFIIEQAAPFAAAHETLVRLTEGFQKPMIQSRAIRQLAPLVSPTLRLRLLNTARNIGDSEHQGLALCGLVPYLIGEEQQQAVQALWNITMSEPSPGTKVVLLAGMLAPLPPQHQEYLLSLAVEALRYCPAGSMDDLNPQSNTQEIEREVRRSGNYQASPFFQALQRLLPFLEYNPVHLERAYQLAQSGRIPRRRVQAIAGLIPFLPDPLRGEAVEIALSDVRMIPAYHPPGSPRAQSLADLRTAISSSSELLETARKLARTIPQQKIKVETLVALAQHAPEEIQYSMYQEAISTVREPGGKNAIAGFFIKLIDFCQEPLRTEVIKTARQWVDQVEDLVERTRLALRLSPYLPQDQRVSILRDLLVWMQTLEVKKQVEQLELLSEQIEMQVIKPALALAASISTTKGYHQPLIKLAAPVGRGYFHKGFSTINQIADPGSRVQALLEMLKNVTEEHQRQKILRTAKRALAQIEYIDERSELTVQILPLLAEQEKPQVLRALLKAIWAEPDSADQSSALGFLARVLPDDLLLRAWKESARMEPGPDQVVARATLWRYLPTSEKPQAWRKILSAFKQLPDEEKAAALPPLCQSISPEMQSELVRRALDIPTDHSDPSPDSAWTEALVAIAPVLPVPLQTQVAVSALGRIQRYPGDSLMGEALLQIAPFLPPDKVADALNFAKTLSEGKQAEISATLARQADTETQRDLQNTALSDPVAQLQLLTALVQLLPSPERENALDTAQSLVGRDGEANRWSQQIVTLSAWIPDGQREDFYCQVLKVALSRGMVYEQLMILNTLCPVLAGWASEKPEEARRAWNTSLLDAPTFSRDRLLHVLTVLLPFLLLLKGPGNEQQAARALWEQVQAVCTWEW